MGEAKAGCGFLGFFVAILGVMLLIGGGVWLFRVQFAEEIGRGNAEIQIQSANSRINRYESFYDQCNSIVALEEQIDRQEQIVEDTKNQNAKTIAQSTLNGMYATRARGASEYNSDANKDYTAAQFKDSELPFEIDVSYQAGDEKTECN